MNDNGDNTTDNAAQPTESRLIDYQDRCPDCDVAVGEAHSYDEVNGGCDVARCLVTGLQRLSCGHSHDCGHDVWSGRWPGQLDCERLGWMIGPGLPDLNRLYVEATWDAERCAWAKPT
jgi:hypothetical protein